MKCRKCKRDIEDNSIYCNWCGAKQLKDSTETKVPPPTKKGNIYFARMMIDGERVYVSAPTEAEYYAKARATKEGIIESKKPDNRIIKDLVSDYIRQRIGVISPSTLDGYERKSKANLQAIMNLRVKDLTRDRMQKAIDIDKKKYSGKTIREALALVQSATGIRYDDLVLPSKKPKKKPPIYSTEDIKKIILGLAEYGGQVECAGLLALWCSLRRSEILGLKWNDIKENAIIVRSARVYDKNHKLVEKGNKNETSERTIICDKYILDKINALPKVSEFVFSISTYGIWKGINAVCERSGVEHGYLHGFRHANATIMEYIGIPSLYANRRGGWADDHVRAKTYTDIMSEGGEQTAKQIDAFFLNLTKKPTKLPTQEKNE